MSGQGPAARPGVAPQIEDDVGQVEQSLQRLQRALEAGGAAAERFGRGVGGGMGGMIGGAAAAAASIGASAQDAVLGFAGNYAFREARTFARGTALGTIASIASGTGEATAENMAFMALQSLPFGAGGQVVDPLIATGNRVAGITSAIARAGGEVTDEQRRSLFDMFGGQERRADVERRAVARMAAGEVGKYIEGTNVGAALDAAGAVGSSVSAVLRQLGLAGR